MSTSLSNRLFAATVPQLETRFFAKNRVSSWRNALLLEMSRFIYRPGKYVFIVANFDRPVRSSDDKKDHPA